MSGECNICGWMGCVESNHEQDFDKDFHTTKHNRDVALTDLLAELADKYAHVFTPQELERIQELTSPAEKL